MVDEKVYELPIHGVLEYISYIKESDWSVSKYAGYSYREC